MDLTKLKGLFTITPNEAEPEKTEKKSDAQTEVKMNYQEYGFHQAGKLGGSLAGLKVCLQKLYGLFKEKSREGNMEEDGHKRACMVKIEDYRGHNNLLSERIKKVKEVEIPVAKQKIERLREEFSRIRQHPEEIIGDAAGTASFIMGTIILLFLTIYLFIFYSSASYSAFFKQFSSNDLGIANSIFDPRAITIALEDGVAELLLILTIPFAFLGLGYLIHKFQELKNPTKYIKIALLVVVTFLFDGILAYQITERIYDMNKNNAIPEILEDYSFALAFKSMNFWMIIFAGFIVYLIWGFVFDFTIEAYSKIDKIKIALSQKQLRIQEAEVELKDLEVQIDKMTYTINDNIKEVNKLNKVLEGSIPPMEFQYDIFSFVVGWLAWMKGGNKTHEELNEAQKIVDEFVKLTLGDTEII